MRPILYGVVCLSALLWGCGRGSTDGPPEIRLGLDECAECGMAIHDERSASALVVERDGRREARLFDDIGCMVDFERKESAESKTAGRFVHDHAGGAWLAGESAVFLAADEAVLQTPMASGIAAFADRALAEDGQRRFGGEITDYRGVCERRRAQAEARRAASGG